MASSLFLLCTGEGESCMRLMGCCRQQHKRLLQAHVLAAVLSHCMTGNGNCASKDERGVDELCFLIFTLLHVQSE